MFFLDSETLKFRLTYKIPSVCVLPSLNVLCFVVRYEDSDSYTKFLQYMFFPQNMFLLRGEI
jgi:hypothetical protein